MSRILIITARYAPFIGPRAHRWTAVAEYWASAGHEVHVICPKYVDTSPECRLKGVHLHRVGLDSLKELAYRWLASGAGRGRVGERPAQPGWTTRVGNWLYEQVWKKIYFPDDALLWRRAALLKALQLLEKQHFDAMVTVALPFTAHLVGLVVKKQHPALKWLADTGDPFAFQPRFAAGRGNLYTPWAKRLEKQVLLSADRSVVTTEAALHVFRKYYGAEAVAHMIVIPPLLHPRPGNPEQREHADLPLHLGYFGTFYSPVRTPDAFLRLLEAGFRLRPEWRQRLVIHFYGEIFPEMLSRLSGFPEIRLHGLRSREESRAAMLQMDGLIHIGNTTDFQLPSKIVEYLAAQKPVFHLSYVAADPFESFWGNAEGLTVVRVNGDETPDTNTWLDWLEYVGQERPHFVRDIDPYLIDSIGTAYLRALQSAD